MTIVKRHPLELTVGDVIAVHPDTGKAIAYLVTAPPVACPGDKVSIDYRQWGQDGQLVIDQHTAVTLDTTHRQDMIAGLRELADWLEDNPLVPVQRATEVVLQVGPELYAGDGIAEVDRIAALIGMPVEAGRHYAVRRRFGPVRYQAVVCGPHGKARA